jgi:membrane-associated phospholipid phosphatase
MVGIFSVPFSWAADNLTICSPDRSDCKRPQVIPGADLKLNMSYLKGYVGDTGKILTSPVRWDDREWYTAALVLSMTAGLYAYDQDLKDWVQRRRNRTTDDFSRIFTPFGDALYTLPAAGFVYLYGEVQQSEKAKRIGLLGAESIILAGAFTQVIKMAGHRHRPDTGDQYNRWDGPGFSTDNLSFPSGHASTAFALATVVAGESDIPYVAPAAYGIASLVALSRLNDNVHWSSDVFFGSAVGYFTARAVLRYHKKKNSPLVLLPDVSGDRYGVLMLHRF